MVRVAVVLDGILAEADPGQARVVERRAVGATGRTTRGGDGAADLEILERRQTSRSTFAASGGPNTDAPRRRPVPVSMFRYPLNFANSGFGVSAEP